MGRASRGTRPRKLSHTCTGCGYGFTDADWTSYICPGCHRLNVRLYREEHLDPGRAMFMSEADIREEYRRAGIPMMPVHLSKDLLNTLRNPDWRPEHPRRAS